MDGLKCLPCYLMDGLKYMYLPCYLMDGLIVTVFMNVKIFETILVSYFNISVNLFRLYDNYSI